MINQRKGTCNNMRRKQRTEDPNNPKLSFWKICAWKSSDISKGVAVWIIDTYLLIFCTSTLGMDPVKAGSILFIANIIDAITDLVIGVLLDFSPRTKMGKYRPYELAFLGVMLAAIAVFFCPTESTETFKTIYIFVCYTLMFGVFNTARLAAQIPYEVRAFGNNTALIGKVQSVGGIVWTFGTAMFTLMIPQMIKFFGSETAAGLSVESWRKLILIYLIPLSFVGICRFIFIKESPELDDAEGHVRIQTKDIILIFKKNPYIWAFGLMIFCNAIIQSLGGMAYYMDYVFGDQGLMSSLAAVAAVSMPVFFLLPYLIRKFGAAKLVLFSGILSIIGNAIIFFAGKNFPAFAGGYLLLSFLNMFITFFDAVLMVNIYNYTEYVGLPRLESTTNAVASGLFLQIGQGVGPFLTGVILKMSGFISTTDGAIVTQPQSAITGIRLLNSIIPLVLSIGVIIGTLILTNLEKKMRGGMEAELIERRKKLIEAQE